MMTWQGTLKASKRSLNFSWGWVQISAALGSTVPVGALCGMAAFAVMWVASVLMLPGGAALASPTISASSVRDGVGVSQTLSRAPRSRIAQAGAAGDAPQSKPAMVPPVRREAPPAVDAPPPSAATPSEPRPSTYVSEPPPGYGGIIGAIQDWLARANRDYQGVIIKDLSIPPTNGASNDAIAKKLDETKAEDARAAAAKRAEDDARKTASSEPRPDDQRDTSIDGKAKASVKEEAAQKARAAKQAADAAKTADAARKLADQREAAEAERAAESKRLADAQRAAEAQIADERRKTLERRKAEDQRRADAASAAPEVVSTRPGSDNRRTVIITTEPIPQVNAARAFERRQSRDGIHDDAQRYDSGWRSQASAAKGERRM